jgi:hypothetical protein
VRILGYVLMSAGVLLVMLFNMAKLGGGHLGIPPYVIAFLVASAGWKLRTYGSGIAQQKPAAVPLATPGQQGPGTTSAPSQSAVAAAPPTVEIPMTPEALAATALQTSRSRRILIYVVGGITLFFIVVGICFGLTDPDRAEAHQFLAVFVGIGLISGLLVGVISWLTTERHVSRDLRSPTYLRTTGPVQLVSIQGGYLVRLADCAFLLKGRAGRKELSGLTWGTVDHTPHGHIVLAAWDREGKPTYAIPGYDAAPGASAR